MKKWIMGVLIFSILLLSVMQCDVNQKNKKNSVTPYVIQEDDFNYRDLWKKVNEFNIKVLPKSAL